MPANFCNALCYKCAWYFKATSYLSGFVCMQCLLISWGSFHVQIILHQLGISLSTANEFNTVKGSEVKSEYYNIYYGYSVNPDEIWLNGDWSYTTTYTIFNVGTKAKKRSTTESTCSKSSYYNAHCRHWVVCSRFLVALKVNDKIKRHQCYSQLVNNTNFFLRGIYQSC